MELHLSRCHPESRGRGKRSLDYVRDGVALPWDNGTVAAAL